MSLQEDYNTATRPFGLAEALTQDPTALEILSNALTNTSYPLNQMTEGITHPQTERPLESYRMHFIDTSQYNNPPSIVDAGRAYQEEEMRRAQAQRDFDIWYNSAWRPSNQRTNTQDYTVYTGSAGMRAFDQAMRDTLRVKYMTTADIANMYIHKYKIPSFYEQSHTDEHYIYVFKDIVTKRQLMGDTMNQAVVFATAEMEADNELVTKCKLYE